MLFAEKDLIKRVEPGERNTWTLRRGALGCMQEIVVAAGASAGIGLDALPPVRTAIGSGFGTKTPCWW